MMGVGAIVVVYAVLVAVVVIGIVVSNSATVGSTVMLKDTVHAEALTANGVIGCHAPLDSRYGAIPLEGMLQS